MNSIPLSKGSTRNITHSDYRNKKRLPDIKIIFVFEINFFLLSEHTLIM